MSISHNDDTKYAGHYNNLETTMEDIRLVPK